MSKVDWKTIHAASIINLTIMAKVHQIPMRRINGNQISPKDIQVATSVSVFDIRTLSLSYDALCLGGVV